MNSPLNQNYIVLGHTESTWADPTKEEACDYELCPNLKAAEYVAGRYKDRGLEHVSIRTIGGIV